MRRTLMVSVIGTLAALTARTASALPLDVVPRSVNLDQKLRMANGQVLTKREILKRIPDNATIRLSSGKTIRWHDMLKLMKMLEDQSHTPLATMPRVAPLRPQTASIAAQQRRSQSAEIQQMQDLEHTHWATIIQRKYQYAPHFGYTPHLGPPPGGGPFGGGVPRGMPGLPGPAPGGGAPAPACNGVPDRSPDGAPWSTTLGDPSAVSATLSFDFDNQGDKSSAGCQASLDAHVSVLKNPIDVAKATLSGKASLQSVSGEVDVYLFGAQVWTDSGSIGSKDNPLVPGSPGWSKNWNSPTLQVPVFAGVVYLEAGASVGLHAQLAVSNVPQKGSSGSGDDTIAACSAEFDPNADAKAQGFVQISVDLPQSIKDFLNLIGIDISDLISAGLEGTIDAANFGIPTKGGIALGPWDRGDDSECDMACGHDSSGDECTHFCSGSACMVLGETLSSQLTATFLSGEFDAYLQVANPCFDPCFGALGGCSTCLSDLIHDVTQSDVPVTSDKSHIKWTWTIYSEPGFQYSVPIFGPIKDEIALR